MHGAVRWDSLNAELRGTFQGGCFDIVGGNILWLQRACSSFRLPEIVLCLQGYPGWTRVGIGNHQLASIGCVELQPLGFLVPGSSGTRSIAALAAA